MGTPYTLRNATRYTPGAQPAEPTYEELFAPGQIERGLRSSVLNIGAGGYATDMYEAQARGDTAAAEAARIRAGELSAEGQRFAPRVQSTADIHGVGDFTDWAGGIVGQLPTTLVPAVAGGMLGGGLGGALVRGAGATLGSLAGASGALYPQLRDAARMQQSQAEAQGAPVLPPQEVLDDTSQQAGWQSVIEGFVPGLGARSLIGAGGRVVGNPLVAGAKRVGRDIALDSGAAGIAEGVAMNYESGRNPNRDTSGDQQRYIDAMAGDAIGGGVVGVTGAAADTAYSALGTGARATGDAAAYAARLAEKGGKAGVAKAKQAWDNRPQSLDEAAVMVGEGAANVMNQAEDAVTRLQQRGKDPDVDVLLAKRNDSSEQAMRADDQAKHQAATNFIAKNGADTGLPEYVRKAMEEYKAKPNAPFSWEPLAAAVNDMHREQDIATSFQKFAQETALKVGEGSAKLMNAKDDAIDTYRGKRAADGRANAQTPDMQFDIEAARDDLSPLIDEALAPLTGLKSQDALDNALPSLAHGLRAWTENGFALKKGGEPVVPAALFDMFTDPKEAVAQVFTLLHKQGIVDDSLLPMSEWVLEKLDIMADVKKAKAELVHENLVPTEAAGANAFDHDRIARLISDEIAAGRTFAANGFAKRYFGPRAGKVLDAFRAKDAEAKARQRRGEKVEVEGDGQATQSAYDEGDGARTQSAYDEGDGDTSYEDMNQMTTAADPNEDRADTKFHGFNPRTNAPYKVGGFSVNPETGEVINYHDKKADENIAALKAKNGGEVKRVGYMDYLRETHADAQSMTDGDGQSLMDAAVKFMQDKESEIRTITEKYVADGKKPPRVEDIINKNWYVLKETTGRKGEGTNATAESLGREGNKGQIIGNEWAEDRTDGEHGTVERGRIWLERKMSDGSTKAFATSTQRIISRMSTARKDDGRVDESAGLAGQVTLLNQGLASLLSAAHAAPAAGKYGQSMSGKSGTGASVLTGRIGVKGTPTSPVRWLKQGEDLPANLAMHSNSGKTYGDAKAAARTQRDDELVETARKLLPKARGTKGYKALAKAIETRNIKALDDIVRVSDQAREEESMQGDTRSFSEHTFVGPFEHMQDAHDQMTADALPRTKVIERKDGFYIRQTTSTQLDVGEIGADTSETRPKVHVSFITRDANKNVFGSKKAAQDHADSLTDTDGVTLRVVRESDSALAKTGDASTRTGKVANRAKRHWVIERTAKADTRTKTGLPTEISEMGQSTNFRSRQEDGADDKVRNADELTGEAISTDARETAAAKSDRDAIAAKADAAAAAKETRAQRTAFLVDGLNKGVPAFVASVRKVSAERQAALVDHLKALAEAGKDNPIWGGKPPADMKQFAARARVALVEMGAMKGAVKKPVAKVAPAKVADSVSVKEHQSSGYRERTKHNADSAGLTVAIAADYSTAGEKLTKSVAGDKYLAIALDVAPDKGGTRLAKAMRQLNTTTLNVAGNGIYTLTPQGHTQASINQHVYDLIKTAHDLNPITKIVTGGQTGVDLAGAVAAHKLGIPVEVTMPKNFVQRDATGRDAPHTAADVQKQIAEGSAALKGAVDTKAPSQKFNDVADKMHSYLDNPPADFNVTQVKAISDWATKQEARLNDAKSKVDELGDEFARLDDLRFEATMLKAKAEQAIKNEAQVEAYYADPNSPVIPSRIGQVADFKTVALTLSKKQLNAYSSAAEKLQDGATKAWLAGKSKKDYLSSAIASAHLAHLVSVKAVAGEGFQMAIDSIMNNIDQMFAAPLDKTLESSIDKRLNAARKISTLGDMMSDINASALPDGFKAIAKAVAKVAGSVPVLADRDTFNGTTGFFRPTTGEIFVNTSNVGGKAHTLLHEGVHAATAAAIVDDAELHKAVYSLMAHVVNKNPKLTTAYGLTNSLEFLAEGLTNVNLQRELFKIPASSAVEKYLGKTLANAWDAFVGLVRKALKLPAEHTSALAQLLELGGRAMKYQGTTGRVTVSGIAMNDLAERKIVPLSAVDSALRELAKTPLLSAVDRADFQRRFIDKAREMAAKNNGLVTHGVALTAEVVRQLLPALAARNGTGRVDITELHDTAESIMTRHGAAGVIANAMSTRIHEDLSRPGFAATHDSPKPHEGKFDWRAHIGSGEGNAAFGAGTYLSTSDGVHRNYKEMFTAMTANVTPSTASQMLEQLRILRSGDKHAIAKFFGVDVSEVTPEAVAEATANAKDGVSPTYEVSVDIKPEQLLDWNKPLSEQSAFVQKAALKSLAIEWNKRKGGISGMDQTGEGYAVYPRDAGGFDLFVSGKESGVFDTEAQAKAGADQELLKLYDGYLLYTALEARLGSQTKASDYLQSLGILGHKFNAAGGRNAKHPNYVIYDDSKITTNYVHFNKQDATPATAATKEEQDKFHADIMRRLGPQMKSGLLEVLMGKNARGKDIYLSGKWEKGAIYASLYARDLGQVGAHESFHEFFSRMRGEPAAAEVLSILDRAANSPVIVRQLERLLDGETEALKQIKQGAKNSAEERMAYMFQFWHAGLLKIGPETETVFQKLARFFRKVAGLVNADEKAEQLLRAFDEGRMQTPDAAARVLADSVTARAKLYSSVNTALKPAIDKGSRLINTSETNLERQGVKEYHAIRRLFKRAVGESGGQGYLDAKDHMMKQKSAELFKAFQDDQGNEYSAADLALAAKYLHTGKVPTDKVVKDIVRKLTGPDGILPRMHGYLNAAGVQRWEADPNVPGKGEWVPMGKIDKKYFPRVYDTALMITKPDEFVADFAKYNAAELNKIAAEQNTMLAKGDKDFTPVTAEDVARSILNRLINAYGEPEIEENSSAVGFSPVMAAVNKRSLHWMAPEMLEKYGEKDVARIMTSYIAQGVKRAEYVRRFGNGGERLQTLLEDGYKANVKQLMDKGLSADDAKLKALKVAKGAATDVMALEGTLGYDIKPGMRRFQNSLLVYENMRLLSTSLFSQFIDPLNMVVRGGTMSDAWSAYKRGLREVVASIKGDPIKDLDAQISAQVGTLDANGFLAAFGQLQSSQYMGDKFRKVNEAMFRFNGMEGFNRGMQIAGTRAATRVRQLNL